MQTDWYKFNFVVGEIPSTVVSEHIEYISRELSVGAHNLFLGQIRNDAVGENTVECIEYTANEVMAQSQFFLICSEAKEKFGINKVSILHSLGIVNAGQLCLMVLVACGHRKESFLACEYIVERLKKEVPIWGKEILENKSHQWKVNKD